MDSLPQLEHLTSFPKNGTRHRGKNFFVTFAERPATLKLKGKFVDA